MIQNIESTYQYILRLKNGGTVLPAEAKEMEDVFLKMEERLQDYEHIIAEDQRQMKKAVTLFKRYKGWPAQIMPPLSELLEWLMERSSAEQALFFKEVLEDLLGRLDQLGKPSITRVYEVDGTWLMGFRVAIINALMYGRPSGRRPRSVKSKAEAETADVG